MEEKLLPIGSVVKLKNGQKRLMITGFLQMEQDEKGQKNIWDYSGCLYPEGMLTSEANYAFTNRRSTFYWTSRWRRRGVQEKVKRSNRRTWK